MLNCIILKSNLLSPANSVQGFIQRGWEGWNWALIDYAGIFLSIIGIKNYAGIIARLIFMTIQA